MPLAGLAVDLIWWSDFTGSLKRSYEMDVYMFMLKESAAFSEDHTWNQYQFDTDWCIQVLTYAWPHYVDDSCQSLHDLLYFDKPNNEVGCIYRVTMIAVPMLPAIKRKCINGTLLTDFPTCRLISNANQGSPKHLVHYWMCPLQSFSLSLYWFILRVPQLNTNISNSQYWTKWF